MKLIAKALREQIVNYYCSQNHPRFSVIRFSYRNQYVDVHRMKHKWSHAGAFRWIIGWRDMLNPESKIFRSVVRFWCTIYLHYFYVTILRDRELIGCISRLVQFFPRWIEKLKKSLFLCVGNITHNYTKISCWEPYYNISR